VAVSELVDEVEQVVSVEAGEAALVRHIMQVGRATWQDPPGQAAWAGGRLDWVPAAEHYLHLAWRRGQLAASSA
jgi:hypothetical protein